MDGVTIKANQLITSSSRLFSNTFFSQQQLKQQIDSQLVAFYTILTVALSVLLLSFHKQSRHLFISATTTTSSKCYQCIQKIKLRSKIKSQKILNFYSLSFNKSKNVKLKRLRSSIVTAATVSLTCTNYLFKPILSKTVSTMKKTTSHLRRAYNSNTNLNYNFDRSSFPTSQTVPNLNENNHIKTNLRRSKSTPKIYNSRVRLYKKLPLRSMSRAWGNINSIDLPIWCRKPCYYTYSWLFNCNLDEIDIQDLNEYKNLSEFFRRGLKPDARVIDNSCCLISPCDGKILHHGVCDKGYLEQVKGVNYSLQAFLGDQTWPKNALSHDSNNNLPRYKIEELKENHELYEKNVLYNPNNRLYHCIIYLAPGDYHRFHSPADWTIYYRRHFPGELFSVNPSVARWLQGLFNLNERVVYYGEWKYGFFSMTAVGATNVGSIRVYMDKELTTNNKSSKTFEQNLDRNFCETTFSNNGDLKGVKVKRGDNFGEFNLGSTIVLIFEAPKNFDFNISQNDKVLFGSQLGSGTQSTFL